ncbi:MAG: putative RNA methyltransferase [Propioniciclava sp.]
MAVSAVSDVLNVAAGLLGCPRCGQILDVGAAPVRCPAGHSFDPARQGYLNLLGAASPPHADTAAMVAARERVLASGVFDPLDDLLGSLLTSRTRLLDAGGGTGHHLARALDRLPDAYGVSVDISVAAARRAARAHPRLASVVADTWAPLPIRTGAMDAVLCVFAPRNPEEFARVLTADGAVVVVTPEADHLVSVRSAHGLLGIEAGKADRLLRTMRGTLALAERHRVCADLDAGPDLVADLIAMGPNAFHRSTGPTAGLRTRLAVTVWVFRKAAAGASPRR